MWRFLQQSAGKAWQIWTKWLRRGCQSPSSLPDFCRGQDAKAFALTVIVNATGTHAFIGYEDDGVLILDIDDVTRPKLLAQTPQDLAEEGNTHIGVPTMDERITVASTDVYEPIFSGSGSRWDNVRLFDTADIRHPVQVGNLRHRTLENGSTTCGGCNASTFGVTTYCGFSTERDRALRACERELQCGSPGRQPESTQPTGNRALDILSVPNAGGQV
jgi:hypothetical protein